MSRERAIKVLFRIAGLYDAVLGAVFLIAPAALFAYVRVEPPNHFGYVQFPALFASSASLVQKHL